MAAEEMDFKYLAENSLDTLCRVGLDQVIRYISPSCYRLLGWLPEEMEGKTFEQFLFAEDRAEVDEIMQSAQSPDVHEQTQIVRVRRKDGSAGWIESNSRIIRDDTTGEALEMVVVVRDYTERKQMQEALQMLAMTDGLTGLANRRAFDETLEREWKRTLREGTQISLLLVDVDHFKRFNDEYGHQVGDDCLRTVAAAIRNAVRSTDLVARYGGEEIAVILPAADAAGAGYTAEKVRSTVELLCLTHAGNPESGSQVTASIGVATALARHGGTMRMPESLVQAADNALYKAKRNGRNRVEMGLLIAPQESRCA